MIRINTLKIQLLFSDPVKNERFFWSCRLKALFRPYQHFVSNFEDILRDGANFSKWLTGNKIKHGSSTAIRFDLQNWRYLVIPGMLTTKSRHEICSIAYMLIFLQPMPKIKREACKSRGKYLVSISCFVLMTIGMLHTTFCLQSLSV